MTDITAVITAHAEGTLAGLSLRSLIEAVDQARAAGLSVECLAVLDNPDPATVEAVADAAPPDCRVERVSRADQGRVRNDAVGFAGGEYVAFLDGDDLWSSNWLTDAYAVCGADAGRVIAHPEVNWFFGDATNLHFLPDQADPDFDAFAYTRVANPWDALCLAPAAAYHEVPFASRAIADGIAYEDWHWNMDTLVAGYRHRVVPETIHFKRRRGGSQFAQANANRSLTPPSPMLDYTWLAEHP